LIYLVAAPIRRRIAGGLGPPDFGAHAVAARPPIRQPFYDVMKLWDKQSFVARRSQNFYIGFFLVMIIFTGALFFGGSDFVAGDLCPDAGPPFSSCSARTRPVRRTAHRPRNAS